jgi:hypothetical protein
MQIEDLFIIENDYYLCARMILLLWRAKSLHPLRISHVCFWVLLDFDLLNNKYLTCRKVVLYLNRPMANDSMSF